MRIEKDQLKTLIAIIVMVSLYVGVGWLPQRAKAKVLDAEIAKSEERLDFYRGTKEDLSKKEFEVSELRQQSKGAQRYVPTRDELSEVLKGLTQALRANELKEQEFVTRSVKEYVEYSALGLRMEFDAAFPEAYGVLKDIEGGSRLIRIDRLKIGQGDGDEKLRLELDMSTFFAELTSGNEL
ncbi:type 4a pilus biogenesis protein PilO [Planctomycetota bacterium]|nr:type 4a pilus biogenesis protein PilO [Planctomycetota bacterium]